MDAIAKHLDLDFSSYLREESPYLTSKQISTLIDQGFTIGSHALDHANFRELSLEEQIKQVIVSMDAICKRFSIHYRTFAFPYSDKEITREFFNRISSNMDATFGNQGLLEDCISNHYQRISVEKTSFSGKDTTKYCYLRNISYKLLNKHLITRK
jgi:peptidoglycan/xylan/chitin deacetylase (PgdA/CDA1 family)